MKIYREPGAIVIHAGRHSLSMTFGFLIVLAIGLPIVLAVYFRR